MQSLARRRSPLRPSLRQLLALALLTALFVAALPAPSFAAPGDLDRAFNTVLSSTNAQTAILALVVRSDGKLLISGSFTQVGGTPRKGIARLNTDGSLDSSFNPGSGANGEVRSLAVQPDGRLLVGGNFNEVNGTSRRGIARLNADGTLDSSFDPGSGVNGDVRTLTVLADGKVIIGGFFDSVNGTPRNSIARLNADGTLDSSFDPGSGADGPVNDLVVQADDKVLIGGSFTDINGTARNRIARLNANGSLDTSFDPGAGASATVNAISVLADGKLLIGGNFFEIAGTARRGVARLNADGSLDTAFDPGSGLNAGVTSLALQPDGKLLIGGSFTLANGTARNRIARFNADGSLDASFDPGSGANSSTLTVAVQSNGGVLIGGFLTQVNGTLRGNIARLNPDGTLDSDFNPGVGGDGVVIGMAVQADGRLLIGGIFDNVNGTPRNSIARLNADGSLDPSFDPGSGPNNSVFSLAVQSDGKLLIGGQFTQVNGTPRNRVARLNADGSLDSSFDPGSGANGTVTSLAVQADGKVIIGGFFTSVNDTPRRRVARLNADGSLDTSFDPGSGLNNGLTSLAVQADGRVIIGGFFDSVDGTLRGRIARLNADGSLDTTFDPGSGLNGEVRTLAVQPDGKLLIGGFFDSVNGTTRNNVARLDSDGSLDTTFDPGPGLNSGVLTLAVQADGKVLIGGAFTTVGGTARSRIARLNADGTLDASFNPGSGVNGGVFSLAVQDEDRLYIGGEFTQVNGTARVGVARLELEQPEIGLTGNGVTIANGDVTPATSDGTDFGSAVLGQPVLGSFAIRNSGAEALILSGATPVSISGPHAADFSIVAQPSSPVAPNGSVSFQVRFTPSGGGLRSATVSIANDDNDESPFTFAVQGTGTQPTASVSVSVSPASVAENSGTALVYSFTRSGTTTNALTVAFGLSGTATLASDYTVAPAGGVMASGGTLVIPAGASSATLTVTPVADSLAEASETVVLTVASGTGYSAGTPATATGTITNVAPQASRFFVHLPLLRR